MFGVRVRDVLGSGCAMFGVRVRCRECCSNVWG